MRSWMLIIGACLATSVALAEAPTLNPLGVMDSRVELIDDDPAFARPEHDDSDWSSEGWWNVPHRGVWWVRSRVEVPQAYVDSERPVGLYLVAAAASEIWWDGHPIGGLGRVATSASEEQAGPLDGVVAVPRERLTAGSHVLAIRFSTFKAGRGIATPVDSIYLAEYGSPLRWSQGSYRPVLVMGGALMGAGALLALIGWRRRQPAVLSLLLATAAVLCQLGLEVSRAYWAYPYDWHQWRLLGIGVCSAISGLGVLGHLLWRFDLERPWRWLTGVALVQVALLGAINSYGESTWLAIITWLLAASAVSVRAWRRGRPQAGIAVAVVTGFMLVMLIDPMGFMDRHYFLGMLVLVLAFVADALARHARLRRERDAARLRNARLELELLKRHLRPHFLLNTLTSLSEWLETEPETGAKMIEALAGEFRALDRVAEHDRISLEEELALCRAHLSVMGLRQGCRYTLEVEGDTDLEIPPACLHTLVENALTHGRFDRRGGPVRFSLQVDRSGAGGHELRFRCPASLDPIDPDSMITEGTGLAYVRARLAESFGEGARLEHGLVDGAWETRIGLPADAAARVAPAVQGAG